MLKMHGHEGQDLKVINGHELEFLRKMYLSDGSIKGYLNRSIPNLVATDFQNEDMEKVDPVQRAKGLL